ncbi:MAG: hypothetical protein ACK4Y9_14875 [Hyphomonas sp.]
MKALSILSALLLPVVLGACMPEAETPAPVLPPPHAPVVAPLSEDGSPPPADAEAMMLTAFEAPTNEIYCSLHRPSQDGVLGERLFISEIAGVPAPAAIGLEGKAVPLQRVSITESDGIEIWTYRNEARALKVVLRLKEVEEGMEYRSYTGTIRIAEPVDANAINIEGTCGV